MSKKTGIKNKDFRIIFLWQLAGVSHFKKICLTSGCKDIRNRKFEYLKFIYTISKNLLFFFLQVFCVFEINFNLLCNNSYVFLRYKEEKPCVWKVGWKVLMSRGIPYIPVSIWAGSPSIVASAADITSTRQTWECISASSRIKPVSLT